MDLLVKHDGLILFNAQFKRPTTLEGQSPRNSDVVDDAFNKANRLSPPTKYFVTSNFNEYIVWDNTSYDIPLYSRDIYVLRLQKVIRNEADLDDPEEKAEIREKIQDLCKVIL
jgi:hypothetical protein